MSIFQVYATFYILDYGSNTQAIVTNACTCYLVIQLITLQLKLDILGGKLFSYILSLGKRYFCGWEKLILYEILTKSLSVAHSH